MEKCEYCTNGWHPMTRWARPGKIIFVCDPATIAAFQKIKGLEHLEYNNCEEKALADGYTKRQDLTPRR